MIKLGINGACGRIGRRGGALARQDQGFAITTALEAPDCTYIDQDYGPIISDKPMGLKVTSRLGEAPEVIIDFSSPQSTTELVPQAIDADTRLVIGTTGLTDQHIEQLRGAAKKIPILQAANMSLGINLLLKLLGQVAQALGKDYDIEISETHHRKRPQQGRRFWQARPAGPAPKWQDRPARHQAWRHRRSTLCTVRQPWRDRLPGPLRPQP